MAERQPALDDTQDIPVQNDGVFTGRAQVTYTEKPREVEVVEVERDTKGRTVLISLTAFGSAIVLAAGGFLIGSANRPNAGPQHVPAAASPGASLSPEATSSATATSTPSASPTPGATSVAPSVGNPAPVPEVTTSTTEPAPSYVNEIIQAPNGTKYYVGTDGRRHLVLNFEIERCITVRRETGEIIPVPSGTIGAIPEGVVAHCPYDINDIGELNFVTPDGVTVYLVQGNVKRHAGTLCPAPYSGYAYEPHGVPARELDGHVLGPDWFGTDPNSDPSCAELPH